MVGTFRKRSAAQCASSSHLVTVQMIVQMTAVAMMGVENQQIWMKSRGYTIHSINLCTDL